jgi:hypothetical protein
MHTLYEFAQQELVRVAAVAKVLGIFDLRGRIKV